MAFPNGGRVDSPLDVRYLPMTYDHADSEGSATRMIETLLPDWRDSEGKIEFTKFTDGITNTVRLTLPCISIA